MNNHRASFSQKGTSKRSSLTNYFTKSRSKPSGNNHIA